MARKLTIKPDKRLAMSVARPAVRRQRLVYIICAPKMLKYQRSRSSVIYIGTTAKGVHRVASSIANKAVDFLQEWGIKRLNVYLVTCPPRPGTRSWLLLERDLLIAFKIEYGRVPLGNKSGKNFTPDHLSGSFQYRRLVNVIHAYQRPIVD